MSEPSKTIGNMNGPWAIMLRVFLGSYPLVLGFGVWLVKSIHALDKRHTQLQAEQSVFMSKGDRFSLQDAYSLERRIDARFDDLPPADWREKVENLARENLLLRSKMDDLKDEFTRDFIRKDEAEILRRKEF